MVRNNEVLLRNAQNRIHYNYNAYIQRYKIETNYYLNKMREINRKFST